MSSQSYYSNTYKLLLIAGLYAVISQPVFGQNSLEKKVEQYMKPLVESNDFYGAVLFAKKGNIEFVKGYGYADIEHSVKNGPQSVFHMGSLNKPLTAVGVMLLHQRKVLNIDDFLDKYLPEYPRGNELTIKQLLTQTSGIPSYNDFPDYEEYAIRNNSLSQVVEWFKNKNLHFEPGAKYEYSNSNFVLLAHLIEVVSKEKYGVFMRDNIFEPLNMDHTGMYKYDEIVPNRAIGYDPANNQYNLAPVGYYNNSIKVGSGAMHSTVLDMFKFDQALYTEKILNTSTKELMFTEVGENDYGLGWGIWPRFDKKKQDHDGASPGTVAYFSRYPDDSVTIIFLGNINSGVFNPMKYDLAAIYFNETYTNPSPRRYIEVESEKLSKYEGRYEFENGNFFDLKVIEGALRFLWRGRGELGYLLSPMNGGSFYMRARGDQINFNEVDGKVKAIYKERSGESELKKTR